MFLRLDLTLSNRDHAYMPLTHATCLSLPPRAIAASFPTPNFPICIRSFSILGLPSALFWGYRNSPSRIRAHLGSISSRR
jgi:hypothetical protein